MAKDKKSSKNQKSELSDSELLLKLAHKWVSVPVGILITSLAGTALNLTIRFGPLSNEADAWVQNAMLLAVQSGYYSGIIAGVLVDNILNIWTYCIAAGLSAISYTGLAWCIGSEFAMGHQLLTIFLLFVCGVSAQIGTVTSIVSVVKNFDDQVSTLLVCLLITYLQTAQAFDNSLKGTFFPESSDQTYLIVIGIIVTIIYLFGSLANRKVELPEDIYERCKKYDPLGVFFYIVVLGIYIISYWLFVLLLEIFEAGMIVIFGTLLVNFLILLPIIFVT